MTMLPIANGVASFSTLRKMKACYVDKTALMYRLVNGPDMYVFLSRPKRFGKSVLCDTIASYFEGEAALFDGLAVSQMENEWKKYPVIRFDLNGRTTASGLASHFDDVLRGNERRLRLRPKPTADYASRLQAILLRGAERSGLGAVVIIDEYDYTLQHTWGKAAEHAKCVELMHSMFDVLKSCSEQLRFVFVTGIARFAKVSLFSSFNNLTDISLRPEFQALCGITQRELDTQLREHVQRLADENEWTLEEAYERLKEHYDGYHFSAPKKNRPIEDVYNPNSLMRALGERRISDYWGGLDATVLGKFVPDLAHAVEEYEAAQVQDVDLELSDVGRDNPALFLYQIGLLTIRSLDDGIYTLRFPNRETRVALARMALDASWVKGEGVESPAQARHTRRLKLKTALYHNDRASAELYLRALLADIAFGPVPREAMKAEERYREEIITVVASVAIDYEREYHTECGIADLVLWTPKYIYVIELKTRSNHGAAEACRQLRDKRYLEAFRGLGREVVGWGIGVEDDGKGLIEILGIRD